MLENTNCNFYAKDYEGNGWESLEPPLSVKRYLQAYFRRVPSLQDIAARVVGGISAFRAEFGFIGTFSHIERSSNEVSGLLRRMMLV